ncbi:CG1801, partial [Drosophila busckii]
MPATFKLLFKHNINIELALWRRTAFEAIIVLIILFAILADPLSRVKLLLYSRTDFETDKSLVSNKLEDISILTSLVDSKREQTKYQLAYTPDTPMVAGIVETVARILELNGTTPFKTEEDLQNQFDDRTTLAGVVFEKLNEHPNEIPETLSISIRFPSEFRTINPFQTEDRLWLTRCSGMVNPKRDNAKDPDMLQDLYIREGFLQLQHQIFLAWYHKLIARYKPPNPQTDYNIQVHNIRLRVAGGRCSTLGSYNIPSFLVNFLYLLPFLNIVRNIAAQLKDNVMVHRWHYGYSFTKQWLCLFLVIFLRLMFLGIVVLILSYTFWSFEEKKLSVLVFFLMIIFIVLFSVQLIITAMVIAKLFKDPLNCVLFAICIWLFNYAVFCVILKRYWDIHGLYVLFILMVFFSNQMPFSMDLFRRIIDEPHALTTLDICVLYISAVACTAIYLLILFLMQWRAPGRLLSRRVAYKRKRKSLKKQQYLVYMGHIPSWHNFEFGDVGSKELMRVRHVYTTHRTSERKILKNLSLRVYMGEVYVLLGHIGSGKLTLLRLMCGFKYPLRGSVHHLGEDVHHMRRCHYCDFRSIENGLSPFLSIEQTIVFHVQLKWRDAAQLEHVQSEIAKWLQLLELHVAKRKTKLNKLTPGQRRIVALCCTLACHTPILLFEEPTLLLTASESQIFWSIVEDEKAERAFVVTTHNIDEAEAIADRIGILSLGVLEASGTPFFLRAKFSSSVELVLIKKPHVPDTPITNFIEQYIPDVMPENEIGDTLTYKLKVEYRPRLQKLLIHLENESRMLGIDHIRVVGSELSDVYMKLVTSFRLQQQVIPDVTQTFKYAVISKKQLRRQQMRAMFYKKMIHSAPNIWPVIMIFTCFILIVIIARLAIVLDVPNVRKNTIELGFKSSPEYMKNIPDITECGYIGIKSMGKTASYKRTNTITRTFRANSFVCASGNYRDDLTKLEELTSLGAVERLEKQIINGYISTDTFHTAPMMLNLLHNIILQLTYSDQTKHRFLVDSHPMPTALSMKISLLDNEIAHINAPLAVGCILPLTVSVFILPLVEEHFTHLRILQIIAGLGLEVYWGINLFWDLFTYFVYSIIIVIIMACTKMGGFGVYENMLVLLLMTVFGLAALPITYLISMYVNTSIVRAFLASVLFHAITGLVLFIIYWDVANSNLIFFYSACMLPGFALLDGIGNIYIQCLEIQLCQAKCNVVEHCRPNNMHEVVPHCKFSTLFKWADPGILPALTFMLLGALFALVLIFWIELHRKEKKFHSSKDLHKMRTATYQFDDGDVADVKQKIAEADMSKCKQSVFLVDQVEAKIPKKGTKINTVSFALNKYMSMGIFGPRNSGKSHLIRQLVGIDGFAFGEIYVRGLDFKYDLKTILGYMGYCPQHDGLLNELTPREHIRLLCMIRGVTENKIGEKLRDICLMLNMTGWMHRKCGVLTAEKRRKLNIALSLVAYNKIFVIDEPTSGMPSTTRREIWNILRYLRYCGKTIIFSSNDELECKVLADFIILFQDSEMLSIGSMQYLRYKYSHGFYLELRLVRDGETVAESEANLAKDVNNLEHFVKFLHVKAELVARLHNWFKYYVPVGHIVYSYLYGAIEKNKVRLNVYDYCIYQANMNIVLAQVQETRAELKRRHVMT